MMNISKVQAHKLPKAATSTLQLVQSEANFSFPDFSIFPDFSLTILEFPDFSRFSRWVATLILIISTHSMVLFQLSNKCLPIINVVVYSIDPGHVGIELYPPVAGCGFQIESN